MSIVHQVCPHLRTGDLVEDSRFSPDERPDYFLEAGVFVWPDEAMNPDLWDTAAVSEHRTRTTPKGNRYFVYGLFYRNARVAKTWMPKLAKAVTAADLRAIQHESHGEALHLIGLEMEGLKVVGHVPLVPTYVPKKRTRRGHRHRTRLSSSSHFTIPLVED